MIIDGSSNDIPIRNVGYSGARKANSGKFKEAMLSIFSKIDDITSQLTSDDPSITIEGKTIEDKTSAGATYLVTNALNRYENQAALIMNLIQKSADLDQRASKLSGG